MSSPKPNESQIDRFKALAKELGADKDEGRWEAQLRKVMAHKPKPEKPK